MIGIGLRSMVAALVLCSALPASASSQVPERIVVDGQQYEMLTQPLQPWLNDPATSARFKPFQRPGVSTALGRGYRGTWAIRDDTLYLAALDNRGDEGPDAPRPEHVIPLDALFSPATDRTAPDGAVPAYWYTGQLVIGQGKWTRPPGYGWNGKYERYLLIDVRQGRVLARQQITELKKAR
jgi:hypothetical protein